MIVVDNEAADRMIAQIKDQERTGGPKIQRGKIKWGDSDKVISDMNRKYEHAK
jgi:hypothetical protein